MSLYKCESLQSPSTCLQLIFLVTQNPTYKIQNNIKPLRTTRGIEQTSFVLEMCKVPFPRILYRFLSNETSSTDGEKTNTTRILVIVRLMMVRRMAMLLIVLSMTIMPIPTPMMLISLKKLLYSRLVFFIKVLSKCSFICNKD